MMNIFAVTNEAYYPRLKVFAKTFAKYNSEDAFLTVLYSELSEKSRKDFIRFSEKINLNTRMIAVSNQRVAKYKLIHQITVEAYYRFMVLDVFPTEDRAMWIDTDTVILGSIKPFYYDDFEDNYVIASPGNHEKEHLLRLGLKPDGCYFNAGVILFNLKKIRNDFNADFLYEAYEKNEEIIRFADQDVLNLVFAGKIKRDDSRKYNYIVTSGQNMSHDDIKKIKTDVIILHYIRHIKPWQYYYAGSVRYIYLKEMFRIYPFQSIFLFVAGEIYKLKKHKKTLENSNT